MLVKIVDTYIELNPEEQKRFAAEIERHENKEVREMVVTWDEALADSRAKGLTAGRVQATQEAILLWTRSRFPSLPEDFEQKIRAIDDLNRLHEILERIPETSSVKDFGL